MEGTLEPKITIIKDFDGVFEARVKSAIALNVEKNILMNPTITVDSGPYRPHCLSYEQVTGETKLDFYAASRTMGFEHSIEDIANVIVFRKSEDKKYLGTYCPVIDPEIKNDKIGLIIVYAAIMFNIENRKTMTPKIILKTGLDATSVTSELNTDKGEVIIEFPRNRNAEELFPEVAEHLIYRD